MVEGVPDRKSSGQGAAPPLRIDAETHARALDAVFARSWQLAGDCGVLGDLAIEPFTLLPGSLDEPLVATRDSEGREVALSNACSHRGAIVCSEPCAGSELRCPYHGRRFSLDGSVLAAPGFDLDTIRDESLPRVAFERYGPYRFVSLGATTPFREWIAALDTYAGALPLAELHHDPSGDRSFAVEANWSIYVENYLEGLHIPFVHPSLSAAVDEQSYCVEAADQHVVQTVVGADSDAAFAVEGPAAGLAAVYLWLFPNTMFNLYPWGVSLNLVLPTSPSNCAVLFRRWIADASRLETGAGAALDEVEIEDEAIVRLAQRGAASRLFRPGRLAEGHEVGVQRFRDLLGIALATE